MNQALNQRLRLPMRSQIIDNEIKILESHRRVKSANLGEQGVRKM